MNVLYSTVQHSTAQHSTAQHSTAQHSTVQIVSMPTFLFDFIFWLSFEKPESKISVF